MTVVLQIAGMVAAVFGLAYALVTLRWVARRRPPKPPRNVRAVFPDGRVQPLEVVYGGRDGDGTHNWLVAELLPLVEGLTVTGEALGPRQRIRWACFVGDPPGP